MLKYSDKSSVDALSLAPLPFGFEAGAHVAGGLRGRSPVLLRWSDDGLVSCALDERIDLVGTTGSMCCVPHRDDAGLRPICICKVLR